MKINVCLLGLLLMGFIVANAAATEHYPPTDTPHIPNTSQADGELTPSSTKSGNSKEGPSGSKPRVQELVPTHQTDSIRRVRATQKINEPSTYSELEVEFELLKMTNARLRHELQEKSRIIEDANRHRNNLALLSGAGILVVGIALGFFIGVRISRSKYHL